VVAPCSGIIMTTFMLCDIGVVWLIILFVWLCLVRAQAWLDWLKCSQEHLVSMVLCHIRGQDYHGVHYWSVSVLMQVPWTGYNYPPSRSTLLSLWPHLYIRIACVRLTLRMCKPSVWVCFKYNEEAVRSRTCMPTEVTNGFLVNTKVSAWTLLNKARTK